MGLFILFVKLCMDNKDQYTYVIQVLGIYYVSINLYGLLIMYIDKKKSKGNGSRINERQLFIVTALGGALGTIMGMKLLRHKSKKIYFKLWFPFILIAEIVAIGCL